MAPTADADATTSVLTRILDAFPTERLDLLRDLVRQQIMRVLRRDADDPPGRNDRLMELGLDSLMAVQLRNQLGKALDLQAALPATLMFDYPTIERLAVFLLEQLVPKRHEAACEPASETEEPVLLGPAAIAAMTDGEVERALSERFGRL